MQLEKGYGDTPPALLNMFINSTDTLQGRMFDQSINSEWNDKPPLFDPPPTEPRSRIGNLLRGPPEPPKKEEDPVLLKGMLRKGIPPPLRCAVWLSNVIQSSHPHQELKYAHEYRTLAKVRVLDFAYDALWVGDNAPLAGSQLDAKVDMKRFSTFGNTQLLSEVTKYPPKGQLALQRVLHALDYILGVEHAPMIPTLATLFLSTMSQSYAFTAIREMAHHSNWYWPCSRSEHVAHGRTFLDVLCKLHPSTAATIEHLDIGTKLTDAIFQDMFIPLIPEENVFRIVDIYTLEGTKVLFRFGVALVVLYQKVWKNDGTTPVQEEPGSLEGTMSSSMESSSGPPALTESESNTSIPDERTGDDWWEGLAAWTHSTDFNWELLVRKAYGVHGRGVRKRYRFPRRPILARILKLEEDRYIQEQQILGKNANADSSMPTVFPMALIISSNATIQPGDDREPIVPKLAEPAWVRTKLAEWLPLSLRLTKMDLIFSTNSHGRTLESFYRHCQYAKHTLVLIEPLVSSSGSSSSPAIQAVGMYASQTWIPSPRVYGDGECFLFRLVKDDTDASQCWKWKPQKASHVDEVLEVDSGEDEAGAPPAMPSASTKNNQTALLEQFQVGTDTYISMGGNQDGSSGLRLNEDLTTAESAKASGFNNEPLADGGMFEVGVVEVYQLVR